MSNPMLPQAPVPAMQPKQPQINKPMAISIQKNPNDKELMLGIILAAQGVYEQPQVQPQGGNPGMQLKPGWGGQNR
jgi:hypothetical protein